MEPISAPIKLNDTGPAVRNLQRSLAALIKARGLPLPESTVSELEQALRAEHGSQTYGTGTETALRIFKAFNNLSGDGEVDAPTANALNHALRARPLGDDDLTPPEVHGVLRDARGRPLPQYEIRVFDLDFRDEQQLGPPGQSIYTDSKGEYTCRYSSAEFALAENKRADIEVRAYHNNQVIARSEIYCNAPADLTADLTADGDGQHVTQSEYEELLAQLRPALAKVPFAGFTETDITFLACDLEVDAAYIRLLRSAVLFAIEAEGEQANANGPHPVAAVYYGMMRQGLPADLLQLLTQPPEVVEATLTAAVETYTLPRLILGALPEIIDLLKRQFARLEARPGPPDAAPALADVLLTVLPQSELREAFLALLVHNRGTHKHFWKSVNEHPGLSGRAEPLQRAVELANLTGNHVRLIQELLSRSDGAPDGLARFAALDQAGWTQLLTADAGNGPIGVPPFVRGANPEEKLANYGEFLARNFEQDFPTPAARHRLAARPAPWAQGVARFLDLNPAFDIRTGRVEHASLDAFPETERPLVMQHVNTIQNLLQLTPRINLAATLFDAGIRSAAMINSYSPNEFAAAFGTAVGARDEALQAHARAQEVTATAMHLLMTYSMPATRVTMHALTDAAVLDGGAAGGGEAPASIPDWSTLFGSAEQCECAHCASLLSPATYLTDLLNFLKYRPSTLPAPGGGFLSAKDVLFNKRPDLGDIQLTCANTNTPVPYVDIALEVLETAVSPFNQRLDDALRAAIDAAAAGGTLPPELRNAFAPPLSATASIYTLPVHEGDHAGRWGLTDEQFTYTIRQDSAGLQVVSRSLQTTGDAADRSVAAQYVNAAAYDRLKSVDTVYPWSLPFDLHAEVVRSYLGHLGVHRSGIIDVLRWSAPAETLASLEYAKAYLDLSDAEAHIITSERTADAWKLWGFPAATLSAASGQLIPDPADQLGTLPVGTSGDVGWLDMLTARVDVFLQQSGLRYGELLGLLGSYTINPQDHPDAPRRISIRASEGYPPATCKTSELQLTGLDVGGAIDIVRFVRLQRVLGWSTPDLDRAIRALDNLRLGTDTLTRYEVLLIRLAHLQRLHREFNLPIEQLSAWWADIDTMEYTDHDAPGQPIIPTFYDRLFRDKAVLAAGEPFPAFDHLGGLLASRAAEVAAALGLKSSELAQLSTGLGLEELQLNTLSALYRHVALARALHLSISHYLIALSLLRPQPFEPEPGPVPSPSRTAGTLLFIDAVHRVERAGLSMPDLDYLLRHRAMPGAALAPDQSVPATFLSALRVVLQEVAASYTFRTATVPAAEGEAYDPASPTSDLEGELTRKQLALLNWKRDVIDLVVATLGGQVTYEAALDGAPSAELLAELVALPNATGSFVIDLPVARLAIPAELAGAVLHNPETGLLTALRRLSAAELQILVDAAEAADAPAVAFAAATLSALQDALEGTISYDAAANVLRFSGPMTDARKAHLVAAVPADPPERPYARALDVLYDAPRRVLARHLRRFSVPTFSVPPPEPPAERPVPFDVPLAFAGEVFWDQDILRSVGPMRDTVRDALLAPAPGAPPLPAPSRAAVLELYQLPERASAAPLAEDSFLAPEEVRDMFAASMAPAERFAAVLRKLMPYLRHTLSRARIAQQAAEAFSLEARTAAALLEGEQHDGRAWIETLADQEFVDSNPNVPVTAQRFPLQFAIAQRLHKAALLAARLSLTHLQVGWLQRYGRAAGWLRFDSLPIVEGDDTDLGASLLRLLALLELRDSFASGEPMLDELFDIAARDDATAEQWEQALLRWTGWPNAELQLLLAEARRSGALAAPFPEGYTDERLLLRLRDAFALLQRLGVSAADALALAGAPSDTTAALAQQTVRAKYTVEQWRTVAKPLRDGLREKQRAALVAYLIGHALERGLPRVRNANDLYARFLIDVEMSACMMTSRIKQAISSVQLFAQRCRMGLQDGVRVPEHDDAWQEWEWRKTYRVWEANRKILFYPENWLEPELRDDKSPLFRELEGDLLQGELNRDSAEQAFMAYLQKLDKISRLEVMATYHELETAAPGSPVDILHVFARTAGDPRAWYYRRLIDGFEWTAWEQVQLDITGDHLVPVVWNRRLMLFWPMLVEKAAEQNVEVNLGGTITGVNPQKYWEMKLCWSEHRNGKWTEQKISTAAIRSDRTRARRPHQDYLANLVFRSWIDPTGKLHIAVLDVPEQIIPIIWPVWTGAVTFLYRSFCFADPVSAPILDIVDSAWLAVPRPGPGTEIHAMTYREQDGEHRLFLPGSGIDMHETDALALTPGTFTLLPYADGKSFDQHPFFYQDDTRRFLVRPSKSWGERRTLLDNRVFVGDLVLGHDTLGLADVPIGGITVYQLLNYTFQPFYHPHTSTFIRKLAVDGIDGLLARSLQLDPLAAAAGPAGMPPARFDFQGVYAPVSHDDTPLVVGPYPDEDVDFGSNLIDGAGACALYNWELFFHAPLLIATRLCNNQQFEEAIRWFHFIFDPAGRVAPGAADPSSAQRFWITKPFFLREGEEYERQVVENLLRLLSSARTAELVASLEDDDRAALMTFRRTIERWRRNPFKPHLVARGRPVAYQKATVMKYLDALLAWGDQLFRRDTLETINEATQLYVLAAELLGPRPQVVPARAVPRVHTFNTLESRLDDLLSTAMVEIERFIVPSGAPASVPGMSLDMSMLYFCVPKNDKLLGYWDMVADRLFKIRHCMNIEGVVRQLPLFEPPIDPAMLVRAAAAGVDLVSVLNDAGAPLPHYRFGTLALKATELCGELKSLGQALLSALEKKDAEHIALLRSTHEIALLEDAKQVRSEQVREAAENLLALEKSRAGATTRYEHYEKLLGVASAQAPAPGTPIALRNPSAQAATDEQDGMIRIGFEVAEDAEISDANAHTELAERLENMASIAHAFPNANISPFGIGVTVGGSNVGGVMQALAKRSSNQASRASYRASRLSKNSHYALRAHDWLLQSNVAAREIMQIDQQTTAAQIRLDIMNSELRNHVRQIERAKEINEKMQQKFSNQDLYGWQVGQLSGVYFQTYQLVYDLAKRAERAFRHELGVADSSFVQFGYWDSLKKGLSAGDRLFHDIKRMEVAYLDQNRREYEITRHVSLRQLDPIALLQLRETGSCTLAIPEELFDMDLPGQYMRRIKSVSLSVPCVTGPYTGVNCMLTLLRSSVRRASTLVNGKYPREEGDPRFQDYVGIIESVATSSGQNDSGLFEPNLRDERYLPFEGAGVISEWRVELPTEVRKFDYDSISDVVLHIRYTARDGGELLRNGALANLKTKIEQASAAGMVRLLSVRHDFPAAWARFQQVDSDDAYYHLALDLHADQYPYWLQGRVLRPSAQVRLDQVFVRADASDIDITDALPTSAPHRFAPAFPSANGHIQVAALEAQKNATGTLDLYFSSKSMSDVWVAAEVL